jgi:G3E family GTPase
MSAARAIPVRAIPVFVLTGFLGAGKTTLLNRLLALPSLAGTAVVVNELGEAGLDAKFLRGGEIVEMSGGCLCCAWAGSLAETLAPLPADRLDRVVIETSGVADPVGVLEQLAVATACGLPYRAAGTIAVIDMPYGALNLAERAEARRQIALADAIVLSKRDLAGGREAALLDRLRAINPHAGVGDSGDIGWVMRLLLANNLLLPMAPGRAMSATGLDHRHDHVHEHGAHHAHGGPAEFASVSIRHEPPLALAALRGFFDLVASAHGDKVLRMKALANVAGQPVAMHSVRGIVHEPQILERWPDDDRATRLVAIFRDLEPQFVQRLFAGFAGAPVIDAPDAAALAANPLAVPGYRGPR